MHDRFPVLTVILCLFLLFSAVAVPPGPTTRGTAVSDRGIDVREEVTDGTSTLDSGVTVTSHVMTEGEMEGLKAAVGVYDGSTASEVTATGLRAPTEEEWEAMVGNVVMVDQVSSSTLKASTSVDLSLSEHFPAIGNQGSMGSCGAWAETYYALGYLTAKAHGWTAASLGDDLQLLSPLWTYDLQNGGDDLGSYMGGNTNVARTIGVATMASMPYQTNATMWGDEGAWREAAAYQAEAYHILGYDAATEVSTIKALLSSGVPVVFSLYASDFSYYFADAKGNKNNIISSVEYSAQEPDHAQTIVGYSDGMGDGGEQGVFKVANSWGSGWGDDGYYYVTYDAFLEIMANEGEAGYVTLEEDVTSALAVWHYDLAPGRDASIMVSAVSVASSEVLGTVEPYIRAYMRGYTTIYPMAYFMCLDISDLSAYIGRADVRIVLEVGRSVIAYPSGGSPSLSSFRVEQYTGAYAPGKASTISAQAGGLPAAVPCEVSIVQHPLGEISAVNALDWDYSAMSFGGPSRWLGVSSGNGSTSSMQSGDVGDLSASLLVAWVDGPGTLSFDWKVSSEPECDLLRLYIDGEIMGEISGEQGWSRHTYALTSGPHNITWSYGKDSYASQGEDCGWIDNVGWTGLTVIGYVGFEDALSSMTMTDANPASGTDTWGTVVLRSSSGSGSAWCAASGNGSNGSPNSINRYYDTSMQACLTWTPSGLPADGAAHLSFHYWTQTDNALADHLVVEMLTTEGWATAWTQPSGSSGGWSTAQAVLPGGTTAVRFCFSSDSASDSYEGAYLDDVLITVADIDAPLSHVLSLPTYVNSSATTLEWNVTDGTSAWDGYVKLYYRAPGSGSYVLYATPSNPSGRWNGTAVTFDFEEAGGAEGGYSFYTVATDPSGNVEVVPLSPDASTFYDVTSPSTFGSSSGAPYPAWNANAVTVTLTADDSASGVSLTSFRIDGGAWTTYQDGFVLGTEGSHTIQYRSVDAAGNVEEVRSLMVNIDLSTPVLSITSPSAGEHTRSATLTWSASDLSGIALVEVSTNGGAWSEVTGTSAQLHLDDGPCTVYLRAMDLAGLICIVDVSFVYDPAPPSITISAPIAGSFLDSGEVTVRWSASDVLSRVDRLEISIDGSSWTIIGSSSLQLTNLADGPHTVSVRAYDAAGNVQEKAVTFTIDTVAPTAAVSPTGRAADASSSIVISFSEIMDPTSVVVLLDGVEITIGWSGNEARCVAALMHGVEYSVQVYSQDLAGNIYEQEWTFRTVDYGTLSGTLIDEGGGPLANVTVELSNGLRTTTDSGGYFNFSSLAPGPYTIIVRAEGFESMTLDAMVVDGEGTSVGMTVLSAESEGMSSYVAPVLVIVLIAITLVAVVWWRRKG